MRLLASGIFFAGALASATSAHGPIVELLDAPSAHAAAVVVAAFLKAAVFLAFSVFVFVREPARQPARRPVAFVAAAVALLSIAFVRVPEDATATSLVVAGDLVTAAGLVGALVAVVALGRCFSVLPEARGLVTNGPYAVVRHPLYLGELVACAGLVIAAPNVLNAACAGAFVAAQAVRMRLEEEALAAEFPEYLAYAARTPQVIPRRAELRAIRGAAADS
jgi:protein-S-isoprenylcysteine O-methyltransferase Ste14